MEEVKVMVQARRRQQRQRVFRYRVYVSAGTKHIVCEHAGLTTFRQ
jgi:hypothetical protein